MIKKKYALIIAVIVWIVTEVLSWALNDWLSANINVSNISILHTYAASVLSYLSSGFSLGFVLGSALFSMWEWPLVGAWLRKQRERLRNKDADEALAIECERLSQKLYEDAAQIERLRSERHWQASLTDSSDGMHKSWVEARNSEAREEERIRRQYGHQVQRILVQLRNRGIKMQVWGLSLSHYDLAATSYFFADIANSLREGTYLEREFEAGRVGLPARL